MIPKRIILLRHGESRANVNPEIYAEMPDCRIGLTEVGVQQARTAGTRIAAMLNGESFGVFCSPYRRTTQTKDAMLAGMGRAPVFDYQDPSLREQEYGNMPSSEVNAENLARRDQFGYFFYRFPNGESCADVYDRMALFLDSLYRRFERETCPENIVIVSHGTAIRCFLTRWYHWSIERFESLPSLPNCHVSVMTRCDVDGGQVRQGPSFVLTDPFSGLMGPCS